MACKATTRAGSPCKARTLAGASWCLYHSPDTKVRAARLAAASRGGSSGAPVSVGALAEDPTVASLARQTAAGLRGFLAATLRALGRVPFATKTAQAISAIATSQRATLEASSFSERLDALEAAQAPGPKLHRAR